MILRHLLAARSLDGAAAMQAIVRHIGAPLKLEGIWPAVGIVEMVDENMANAARVHAIERGKQPSEYTMVAFGGARASRRPSG